MTVRWCRSRDRRGGALGAVARRSSAAEAGSSSRLRRPPRRSCASGALAGPRAVDRDPPRVAVGRGAADPDVAADVHAHARGAEPDELLGDEVGREPLADPTGVEPDTERDPDGARAVVDLDPVRAGDQTCSADAREAGAGGPSRSNEST